MINIRRQPEPIDFDVFYFGTYSPPITCPVRRKHMYYILLTDIDYGHTEKSDFTEGGEVRREEGYVSCRF